jgi:hypothetical protein
MYVYIDIEHFPNEHSIINNWACWGSKNSGVIHCRIFKFGILVDFWIIFKVTTLQQGEFRKVEKNM